MIEADIAERPQAPSLGAADTSEPLLPLELLELELSLESYDGGEANFCEVVRKAAVGASGEFLFDLPAAGLIDDCKRIAVLRIPSPDSEMRVVLAVLDLNGAEIRMQAPDKETAHLVRFADAFVELLRRI